VTPRNPQLEAAIDLVANALQSALLLAGKLATDIRGSAADVDHVYAAIGRAVDSLRRLRESNGEGGER
jgi:hypothetical protein